MPDDGRVALGGGAQVLVAVVDHPHRLAHLPGQQRGMQRHHGGVLLLAAEPAAGLRLDHHGLGIGQVEGARHGSVDVVRTLARPVNRDAAVGVGDGDHGLVLDVELLLVTDPIGPFDHQLGLGEARLEVAPCDLAVRDLLGRREGVEDGRQPLGPRVEMALRNSKRLSVGCCHQADRLGLVPNLAADRDEDRLVVADQADDVRAGDVGRHYDSHPRPVEGRVEVDREQPRMRLRRPDRGPVPRAGKDEVVGVLREAGQLLRPLATKRGAGGEPPGRACRRRDDQRFGCGLGFRSGGQGARHLRIAPQSPDDTIVVVLSGGG